MSPQFPLTLMLIETHSVPLSNMRWKASKCVFFTGQCRWVHCREKFSLDMSKGQQQISAAVKIPNAELHSEISFTDNFRREKGHRKRFFRPLFSRNELDHFNDPGIRKSGHGWIHNFEGDFKGDWNSDQSTCKWSTWLMSFELPGFLFLLAWNERNSVRFLGFLHIIVEKNLVNKVFNRMR